MPIPVAPTELEVLSAAIGAVSMAFVGDASADHYDVYRSTDEALIGDKINAAPIAQVATPYDVSFIDDVSHSLVPPVIPGIYYYRAFSVDALGVISLPSNTVSARVGLPQVITPRQAVIISIEERGNP